MSARDSRQGEDVVCAPQPPNRPHGALPSPREVPSPLALQGVPQVGDPGCLCLTCTPTMAGAMEPFRGALGHSSPLDGQIPLTALG